MCLKKFFQSILKGVFAFSSISMITGCAGFGVLESSDPMVKLNDAEHLFRVQDRPLIAERLIREAMEIYVKRDDPVGIGHANREYADLLLSPSVVSKWSNFYMKNGFLDKDVTYENRIEKSKEYYLKALSYYSRAALELAQVEKYDALTNVYFNMGWSFYRLNNLVDACQFYDKAIGANAEYLKRNPDTKDDAPIRTVEAFMRARKKEAACVG